MSKRSNPHAIWTIGADDVNPDAVDAYDYALDDSRIATDPADRRTDSKLLVYRGQDQSVTHQRFAQIGDHLQDGDLLVFNDTEVIPARLQVFKETGGRVELFVLESGGEETNGWQTAGPGPLVFECMTRSSRPLRPGMKLADSDRPDLPAIEVRSADGGRAIVEVAFDDTPLAFLESFGEVPLPPYIIKRRDEQGRPAVEQSDSRRYQTVYASTPGAVAAPTAGLHFSRELIEELEERGVQRAQVTLTVGPGTFEPVRHDRLSSHDMHREKYFVPESLGASISACRERGGRVIAVGTTTTRALESEARRDTPFESGWRSTELFLRPGSAFEVCDGLITNFHLPRSTLLALVAGFAGFGAMRHIYETAVSKSYRFYSYGDANLIFR